MNNDLFNAIVDGNLNKIRDLIANSSNVNDIILPPKWTPILIAVESNQLEVVRLLLSNGALVNATNINKQTALHIAVIKNAISIAQLLIEDVNIEINAKDKRNFTPLMYAEESKNFEIVELLIKYGVAQNEINSEQT